ncbi:MAG: methyl-accepting chemotaxis protein [Spirochaetales bacterium]|nr:methyl-accepting chemotaxis protein [Spirochaetales bacterium]
MKTSSKMIYIFGGASLVIFVLVGFILQLVVKNTILTLQEEHLKSGSIMARQELVNIIDVSTKKTLKTASDKGKNIVEHYYNKFLQGELTKDQAMEEIRKIVLDPQFGKVGDTGYLAIVSGNGVLAVHPKSEGVNVSGASFWPKVQESLNSKDKEGYFEYDWQNTDETAPRKKVGYITYFEPWDLIIWPASYKSEFKSLIDINDFKEELLNVGTLFGGYSYVLDGTGTLIAHKEKENENISNYDFVKKMLLQKNGRLEYLWANTEEEEPTLRIMYFSYVEELDWLVCVGVVKSILYEPLNFVNLLIVIGCIVAIIIFLGLSIIIGKMISNKINKFQTIFEISNKGDLTPTYQSTAYPIFRDEIDIMGLDFNNFIGGYKEVLNNLRAITDKIVELIQNLSSSSQETSSIANQQAAAVKEIVSTMEDVDQLSKSIEKKIQEITNIADNTQTIVKSGFEKVTESITKMEEINDANKVTINGIKFLSEQIDNIWNIVNMINGIADQTKIIAFNAELEASAAGEAGKNFQIVATEIRRLADSTVHSTNEIKERITEIQKSSDQLILTSEDGTEKIKEGNNLTKDINSMFKDILSTAETSSDSTKQISKSINQQVVTFEQILIAIKQISEGVDNIAGATRETAGASDSLVGVSEKLENILSKYKLENKMEGTDLE